MVLAIETLTTGLSNVFKFIFGTLSNFIVSLAGDFGELILIAIAILSAWYFVRQTDKGMIKKWIMTLVLAVLFWLTLKLSMGGT